MKKVLITGCSGFLGTNLINLLLTRDTQADIIGMTDIIDYKSEQIRPFHIDIRDRKRVFELIKTEKPDIIFHLAAIASVGFSWLNPKLTYEVNFIGTSNLLEAVADFIPSARILLMSSAEIYGNTLENGNENEKIQIRNPYALSKYAMELLGELFYNNKDLDIIRLRSYNFCGPGQSNKFVVSDLAYQIAAIEKGLFEPVIKAGNLSAVRDFSDVRDIAVYLNIISEKGKKGKTYNLCSGNSFAIKDILDMLLSFSPKKIEVSVDKKKLRPVDIPILKGDFSLLKEEFGLAPNYTLKESLLSVLNYWRDNIGLKTGENNNC